VIDPVRVYSTYVDGTIAKSATVDKGYAVALDADGNTYVTGETNAANSPTSTGVVDGSSRPALKAHARARRLDEPRYFSLVGGGVLSR
jgi:hypothetical protein